MLLSRRLLDRAGGLDAASDAPLRALARRLGPGRLALLAPAATG
jgi:hypothetical protein